MSSPGYHYYGLFAETWDLWRDDTAGWQDRSLFLDLVGEYGEPVLDVGCGTGRILLDFLAQRIDCDGLDNSPEMLAICADKAKGQDLNPILYLQSMEQLDLPRRYPTILVPSSTLQLVTDRSAAEEAVRRLCAHLLPGGALAAPFSFMATGEQSAESDWALVFEKTRPYDGATVRRWSRERYHSADQLWDSEDRFEVWLNDEVITTELYTRCPEGRWYTHEQAIDLFRRAGFHDITVMSGFTRNPATPADTVFTVVATKQ